MLTGLIYAGLQYHIRSSANDPQIYVAENLAEDMFKNDTPSAPLNGGNVDIERSVAPFVILYDSNGRAVDGTGRINGQLPTLPRGVYDDTQKHGEDRVTWQPNANTRVAAVVRYYQNEKHAGFVLAGKNLREVEREESRLLILTAIVWSVTLVGTLALTGLSHHPLRTIKKPSR